MDAKPGLDEESKGQRRLDDSGGGLLSTVEGHNLFRYLFCRACCFLVAYRLWLGVLFVGCLTSQQHASISGTDLLGQFYVLPH